MLANARSRWIRSRMPRMDFEAEGLLDGLEGEEREQREQLLDGWPRRASASRSSARRCKENRLALLPVDRVLGGTYTAPRSRSRPGCRPRR